MALHVPVSDGTHRPVGRDRRPYVRETARESLTGGQQVVLMLVASALVALGLFAPLELARVLVGASMLFLTAYMGLRLVLVLASRGYHAPEVDAVPDDELPRYTTLHPLYDEANMIPLVVAAMEAMDYPKDRLECLLVLEERDEATVRAAHEHDLPDYFRVVVTPAVEPYGKPKACNYALQFATGEMAVIYDAEDKPEPAQLRKAVGTFRAAARRGEPLGCVQARLVFDNEVPTLDEAGRVRRDRLGFDERPTSWTSRLLGNEYAVHFDLILTGLARLGLPVPLGGTSNHFPVDVLRTVAFPEEDMPRMPQPDASVGAWDPWNVTEDAELGGAIAASGWTTAVLDSHTDEEACLTARAALNQRSRWVKGYAQTSLVLLRHPWRNARAMGPAAYAVFLLQVGGTYLSLMLSPIFWTLFAVYALTGSPRIIALFPGPLYYTGMALLILGNLGLLSVSLFAATSRGRYGTIRYLMALLPAWWLLLSAATYVATLELLVPSWRPAWNKTAHGVRYMSSWRRLQLALSGAPAPVAAAAPVPAAAAAPVAAPLPVPVKAPVVAPTWRPVATPVFGPVVPVSVAEPVVPAALVTPAAPAGRPGQPDRGVVPAAAAYAPMAHRTRGRARDVARPQVRFLAADQIITSAPAPVPGAPRPEPRLTPVQQAAITMAERRRRKVREAPRPAAVFAPADGAAGQAARRAAGRAAGRGTTVRGGSAMVGAS